MASGRRYEVEVNSDFAMVFTVRDGKVTEFQEFTDSAAVNAAYEIRAAV